MKLIEALIGIVILVMILGVSFNYVHFSQEKFSNFKDKIEKDSVKISIYNYSNYLLNQVITGNSLSTGFIYFSGNNYQLSFGNYTGSSDKYYFECAQNSGSLIMIQSTYSGAFCDIQVENDHIYNYKLK